ncbi:MAG: hypothetical protein ACREMW_12620 [Gemmatimonadales bacterium]
MRQFLPLLLVAIAVVACERRRAPDTRAMVRQTLHGVIVYPHSVELGAAAGEDAAEITLTTADSIAPVANWFREVLRLNRWELQSDVTGADGSVSIAALRDKRPMWIMLRPNVGGPGTTYSIIGALVTDADSVRLPDSLH